MTMCLAAFANSSLQYKYAIFTKYAIFRSHIESIDKRM